MSHSGCFIWPVWGWVSSSTAITLIVSTSQLPCSWLLLLFYYFFSHFDFFYSIDSTCFHPQHWLLVVSLFIKHFNLVPQITIVMASQRHWKVGWQFESEKEKSWLDGFFSVDVYYSSFLELKRNWPTALIKPDLVFTKMHLRL